MKRNLLYICVLRRYSACGILWAHLGLEDKDMNNILTVMSDTKVYFSFLGILLAGYLLIANSTTIFPFMDDDEYFVDEQENIHGCNCPYRSTPWFTRKHSKYDILIEKDQEICRECLLYEEDKLWELHYINLELKEKSLKINGASEDYIKNKMQEYQ